MNPQQRYRKELEEFLKGRAFGSLEELQAAADEFTRQYNMRPVDDFCGLSSNDMWHILNQPFDSPEIVSFNLDAQVPQDAPRLNLLLRLLQRIDDSQGVKATVKGNLPRNLCRELEKEYYDEEQYMQIRSIGALMSEVEFIDLHVVRILAEMAGYIRKHKKRFIITKRGKGLLTQGITARDFLHILKVYTMEYNWAYADGYPVLHIIQNSFLYTLYLLKKFGNEYRQPDFYSSLFIKAYPVVLDEINDPVYTTREKLIKDCYEFRALRRFAIDFGLADMALTQRVSYKENYLLKKSGFLEDLIIFRQ